MYRKLSLTLILLTLTMLLTVPAAYATGITFTVAEAKDTLETPVVVYVEGEKVAFPDQAPYINEDNRTLVPVRFVSEALGADLNWNSEQQKVDISLNDRLLSLWIGEKEYTISGETKLMDTEAVITDKSRTMVPVRFISEGLGYHVDWEEEKENILVKITSYDDVVGPDGPSLEDQGDTQVEKTKSEAYYYEDVVEGKVKTGDPVMTLEGDIVKYYPYANYFEFSSYVAPTKYLYLTGVRGSVSYEKYYIKRKNPVTLRYDDPDRLPAQVGDTFIDQNGKKWEVEVGISGYYMWWGEPIAVDVLMAGQPVALDIGRVLNSGLHVSDGALSDGRVGGRLGEPYQIWNGEGHWTSEWDVMRNSGIDKPDRDGKEDGEKVSYWIWDDVIQEWMFSPMP